MEDILQSRATSDSLTSLLHDCIMQTWRLAKKTMVFEIWEILCIQKFSALLYSRWLPSDSLPPARTIRARTVIVKACVLFNSLDLDSSLKSDLRRLRRMYIFGPSVPPAKTDLFLTCRFGIRMSPFSGFNPGIVSSNPGSLTALKPKHCEEHLLHKSAYCKARRCNSRSPCGWCGI